jgi:RimJ/RimL family protein N-acetyltransferase
MELPKSSLPVGEIVDATPAARPRQVAIKGRYVDLLPLDLSAHGRALWAATSGSDNESLWTYLFAGPFPDRRSFDEHFSTKAALDDPLLFAIVDKRSGEACGHAALMRIEPVHRVIEVGNILYAPALQRTPGATEAMYLLARLVFEELGYRRYEWKCNALNDPSRRAALRLGFHFEGVFRQHMIVKSRTRDTAWFAMLDSDWPVCKAAFEYWLDPSNFDAGGSQKQSLAALRRALD